MAVNSIPELFEALRRNPSSIVDTPESSWVEFKSEPYQLEHNYAKLELAKDVSSMAAANGVIVLGVKTAKDPLTQQDVADQISPVGAGLANPHQIQRIVHDLVYPRLDIDVVSYPVS